MANRVVVGIIGTCDPSRVAQTLSAMALDQSCLRVLTSESETAAHEQAPVSFVHVAQAMGDTFADDMTRGTGVLPDFGGTAVPGIEDEGPRFDAFSHPDVMDYLAGTSLPPGDEEFYNEAIDDGRCVVVYNCADDATVASARGAFEKAGLHDIRSF